jgi:hypothetical protein
MRWNDIYMAKGKSAYSKRPLWQWILLYVIIGGIIYAAIYFIFLKPKGGYNYGSGSNSSQQSQYNY